MVIIFIQTKAGVPSRDIQSRIYDQVRVCVVD